MHLEKSAHLTLCLAWRSHYINTSNRLSKKFVESMNSRIIAVLLLSVIMIGIVGYYYYTNGSGSSLPPYHTSSFDIIVLPDTQYYSASYPRIFDNQTQWIVNNIANLNITFVTHEGDVIDNMATTTQWQRADSSMSKLDGHIPWGILPGNHDLDILLGPSPSTTAFNTYFRTSRFSGQSWYGGCYNGNNANNYELITEGTTKFLMLELQFNPSAPVLSWASSVLQSHSDCRVILTTHSFLNTDRSRTGEGTTILNSFVSLHANQIFLVLCGHMHGEASRTDSGVHQLLADYQAYTNGGNGYLRILSFHPSESKIYVTTYSPYLNQYRTGSSSQFTIGY